MQPKIINTYYGLLYRINPTVVNTICTAAMYIILAAVTFGGPMVCSYYAGTDWKNFLFVSISLYLNSLNCFFVLFGYDLILSLIVLLCRKLCSINHLWPNYLSIFHRSMTWRQIAAKKAKEARLLKKKPTPFVSWNWCSEVGGNLGLVPRNYKVNTCCLYCRVLTVVPDISTKKFLSYIRRVLKTNKPWKTIMRVY